MAEAPQPLPAPTPEIARPPESPRQQVLRALNTTYGLVESKPEAALSDDEKWIKKAVGDAKKNSIDRGRDTYINGFLNNDTGQMFAWEEGIPVDKLITYSEAEAAKLPQDSEKRKEIDEAITILKANSKKFSEMDPERGDADKLFARKQQEAHHIYGERIRANGQGDDKTDWEEAEKRLEEQRLELVIPSVAAVAKEPAQIVQKPEDAQDDDVDVDKNPVQPKKPDQPQPAPVDDGPKVGVEPPGGLKPGPQETPKGPQAEIPMAIASVQKRIEHQQDGRNVESMEVIEEVTREMARLRMTEDREKWQGRCAFVKQFIPRFWKYTVGGHGATFGKEKSHAAKLVAEAGLQFTTLPHDFLKDVDGLARERVQGNRGASRWTNRRILGGVADLFHEATFTEKALHGERLAVIRELRQAITNPADQHSQEMLTHHGALVKSMKDVISGDYQASEALAARLSSQFGDELIHGVVGEKKGQQAVVIEGPARDFLVNRVVKKLLQNGLVNGQIDEATLVQAQDEMQNFFFQPEFIKWYDQQSQDVKDALNLSLSYGTDLIAITKDVLLPQMLQAKEHGYDQARLDDYLNTVVLKTQVGTLEGGQKGVIEEGVVERFAARGITNQRVLNLYQGLRNGGAAPRQVTDRDLTAATNRAELLKRTASVGVNEVVVGVAAGAAIYTAQRAASAGGNLMAPILGGSIVGGIVRGWQEYGMFTREYQQHNVEKELGYSFDKDAPRRAQMERIEHTTRKMTTEITVPLRELRTKIEQGTLTEQDTLKMVGLLADSKARFEIRDIYGVGLLSASNPQSYDSERTTLEIEQATSMARFREHLNNHPTELTALQTKLGITTIPAGWNAVDVILAKMTYAQMNNLRTGAALTAEQLHALGAAVKGESLAEREKGFEAQRRWRVFSEGTKTAAIGGVFVASNALLNEAAGYAVDHLRPSLLGAAGKETLLGSALEKMGLVNIAQPTHIEHISDHLQVNIPEGYKVESHTLDANGNGSFVLREPDGALRTMTFTDGPKGAVFDTGTVPGRYEVMPFEAGVNKTFSGFGPETAAVVGKTELHSEIAFNMPSQYQVTDIPGGGGVLVKDILGEHEFLFDTDAAGKVIGLHAQDAQDTMLAHFKDSAITFGSPAEKLSHDVHEFVASGGLEKAGMKEVGSPGQVDFHVLWPEQVKLTGDHAGHELEMHWARGYDAVDKQWFDRPGVVNFGGAIDKDAINPHIPGLEFRHDPELEQLIDVVPDKKINPEDLFAVLKMHTGERIYAPLDIHGNMQLPPMFQDANGKPSGDIFEWVGVAALQKTSDSSIVEASSWWSDGHKDIEGIKEHFLASQRLEGTPLPPPSSVGHPEVSFGTHELLYKDVPIKQVDLTDWQPVHSNFGIPFFIPRKPLEAPSASGVAVPELPKEPPKTGTPPPTDDDDKPPPAPTDKGGDEQIIPEERKRSEEEEERLKEAADALAAGARVEKNNAFKKEELEGVVDKLSVDDATKEKLRRVIDDWLFTQMEQNLPIKTLSLSDAVQTFTEALQITTKMGNIGDLQKRPTFVDVDLQKLTKQFIEIGYSNLDTSSKEKLSNMFLNMFLQNTELGGRFRNASQAGQGEIIALIMYAYNLDERSRSL